jgi:alpha-D-ribose 1-methylphosphonate 5-triphosphate synthase subunit PhnH
MSTQYTVNDKVANTTIESAASLELLTAFTDKVGGSQWVYRQLLKAMSEPATILPLFNSSTDESSVIPDLYKDEWSREVLDHTVYRTIYPTTWSVAQSLFDSDCNVYLSSSLTQKSLTQSLRFYTDAQIVSHSSSAHFAFMNIDELANTNDFSIGTLIAPHESCTLIIQVPCITNDEQILLSGPGIKTQKNMAIEGLTSQHVDFFISNNQQYPCGVDIIFCSPTHIAALPRSTTVVRSSILTEVA